jgi:site-specific DNA recombinase
LTTPAQLTFGGIAVRVLASRAYLGELAFRGSATLRTRAHGKTRVYRYYTCYRRTRYDATACGGQRIDADEIQRAITGALAGFCGHQLDLIAEAIAAAQDSPAADQDGRRGELAATEHELARTGATLIEVARQVDQVIASGTHSQRKVLIEALVAQVKITGPGRIVPVFRIPQATGTEHSETSGKVSGVRAMTRLVGPVGLEPTLSSA